MTVEDGYGNNEIICFENTLFVICIKTKKATDAIIDGKYIGITEFNEELKDKLKRFKKWLNIM